MKRYEIRLLEEIRKDYPALYRYARKEALERIHNGIHVCHRCGCLPTRRTERNRRKLLEAFGGFTLDIALDTALDYVRKRARSLKKP